MSAGPPSFKIHSPPHFIGGIVCGVAIYALVSKFELLGNVCFYFGSFSLSSWCIPPLVYYAWWLAAAALVVYGAIGEFWKNTPPPSSGASS